MKSKITVTFVAAFSLLLILSGCGSKKQAEFSDLVTTEGTETEGPEENTGEIFVYICGAVQAPGVYGFLDQARICDAIAAAEGFMDDAAVDYLNQAELLVDGEKIYVPTREEVASGSVTSFGNPDSSVSEDGRININFADADQLQTISGIGETKALAIIQYRQEHGLFSSIEDITNVSGIGESTYQKIKDSIFV